MHYNIYAIQNHTMPGKQISLTIPDDSVEKFKAAEEQFVAKHSSLQILWLKHQRPLREVQIRLKVRVTAGTHLFFDTHHGEEHEPRGSWIHWTSGKEVPDREWAKCSIRSDMSSQPEEIRRLRCKTMRNPRKQGKLKLTNLR